jgi:acetyl-CoA/propionyl-CoA carboxylase carboxyl transferase subunit
VRILRRRELTGLDDVDRAQAEALFAAEHAAVTGGLAVAVEQGYIDEVIEPHRTRAAVAAALQGAEQARGRLSNIPL